MRWKLKLTVSSAVVALTAGAVVFLVPGPAEAHGAMMTPGSRTYLCWVDGLSSTGQIIPQNPACAAAVNQGGPNALYNWFGVLRSDGAGRMAGFIPDGSLCSGGNATYSGFDIARADYPVTHLTSGASFNWKYSNWAAHPGTWYMYVTKDSWSPTRALAWADLEAAPFLQVTNPPMLGSPGTNDGHYYWTGNLPSGKSGRHIIYSVWSRSDSTETFYGCSDVTFDGGNGNVTGIGSGGSSSSPGSSASASRSASASASASRNVSASASQSSGNPGPGGCAATYRQVSAWGGAFQGEVTVRNTGSSSIAGWTVTWTMASGQSVQQLWGGRYTPSTSVVSVRNETWNGTISPTGTATFGFIMNGTPSTPTLSCAIP